MTAREKLASLNEAQAKIVIRAVTRVAVYEREQLDNGDLDDSEVPYVNVIEALAATLNG
jgi:hypothetical protein